MARRYNGGQISGLYGGDARGLYGSSGYGKRTNMIYGKPRRRWPKFLLALIIILIIIFCIVQFACGGFGKDEEPEPQPQEQEQTQEPEEPTGPSGTVTITAVGDCTLGTDIYFNTATNFNAYYTGDPSYNFSRVSGFTSNDDLTICNFEGTLTESENRADKQFAFKGRAEYAQILVSGSVEAANLANNHSYDYGNDAYEETKATLAEAGITTFGYDRVNTYEVNGILVGLFGVNCVSSYETATEQMRADISSLKEQGCQLIIGCFHWGTEGNYDPDQAQVDLAHSAIEAGCDLVIGSHPHVVQGVERYKNRYILYSTGNFVFGGNDRPGDFATMMWQQTFTIENGEIVWNGETENAVSIIPCRLSTSSTTQNDYQPTPLTGADAQAVLDKINASSNNLAGEGIAFNNWVNDDGRSRIYWG